MLNLAHFLQLKDKLANISLLGLGSKAGNKNYVHFLYWTIQSWAWRCVMFWWCKMMLCSVSVHVVIRLHACNNLEKWLFYYLYIFTDVMESFFCCCFHSSCFWKIDLWSELHPNHRMFLWISLCLDHYSLTLVADTKYSTKGIVISSTEEKKLLLKLFILTKADIDTFSFWCASISSLCSNLLRYHLTKKCSRCNSFKRDWDLLCLGGLGVRTMSLLHWLHWF